MDQYDDDQRYSEVGATDFAAPRPCRWVSKFDVLRLGSVGVSDVRPSDRAPAPALEFSFDEDEFLLELDPCGVSRLSLASTEPVAEFTYSSAPAASRYSLDGWDPHRPSLPPRRAVAYMVAMQRCAMSEYCRHYRHLFG